MERDQDRDDGALRLVVLQERQQGFERVLPALHGVVDHVGVRRQRVDDLVAQRVHHEVAPRRVPGGKGVEDQPVVKAPRTGA